MKNKLSAIDKLNQYRKIKRNAIVDNYDLNHDILATIESHHLAYFPDPDGLSEYTTALIELFNRLPRHIGSLVFVFEDSEAQQKEEYFRSTYGEHIGHPEHLFASHTARIFCMSYSNLLGIESLFSLSHKKEHVSMVILDDIQDHGLLTTMLHRIQGLSTLVENIVVTTSSPFLFVEYNKSPSFLKCYPGNQFYFYKKQINSCKIVNYESTIENIRRELDSDTLKVIMNIYEKEKTKYLIKNDILVCNEYESPKIKELKNILRQESVILVKDKEILSELAKIVRNKIITFNELSSFVKDNKCSSLIFFNFYPVKLDCEKYILANKKEKEFFIDLLEAEEEIKNKFMKSPKNELETKEENTGKGKNFSKIEFHIMDAHIDINTINKKNIFKNAFKEKNKTILITKPGINFIVLECGAFLARETNYNIEIKNTPPLLNYLTLDFNMISFGFVKTRNSYSEACSFLGQGFLHITKSSMQFILFGNGKNIKLIVDTKEIDNILLLDFYDNTLDLYFLMRIHPIIYLCEQTNKIKECIKIFKKWRKIECFNSLQWLRATKSQLPDISNGLDFKITINIDKCNLQISNIYDYKTSDIIFFYINNTFKVQIADINKSANLLNNTQVLERFQKINFNDFYYLHCLISRKWRFLNLDEEDIAEIYNHNLKGISLYLDERVNRRFMNIKQIIKEYKPKKIKNIINGVKSIFVTPFAIYSQYPIENITNRVIRSFSADNFIRLSFREENGGMVYRKGEIAELEWYYNYIRDILNNGIFLGNRKYFFLAMSASQLKNNSAWFMAPYTEDGVLIGPDYVRAWLGDFSDIKSIGKYAVRLGQALSTTIKICDIDDYEEEDDVIKNGYCFSDGIGKISPDLAQRIAETLNLHFIPSAFQIRIGGYKGVVGVDPRLFHKLILRNSMKKFISKHKALEIITYSQHMPCHLNRQIIIILESLGVPPVSFLTLQDEQVYGLTRTNPSALIRKYCGFFSMLPDVIHEPFLVNLYLPIIERILGEMSKKGKIFIEKGRNLMGVLDEFGVLEENEVFVQCEGIASGKILDYGNRFVVNDSVVIAKNPCLHPGDVRIARAVDKKELHHLKNVIVFSQKGSRPIFNMCSGSDLDGDVYFCTWDRRLIPPQTFPPDNYTSTTVLVKELVSMTDISNFYIKYMRDNELGNIANAHLAISDKLPKGVLEPEALKLATLFNMGVDFPKTGFVARLPKDLIPDQFPDFMECGKSYSSMKVSGKLYRRLELLRKSCKISAKQSIFNIPVKPIIYSKESEKYLEDAEKIYKMYKEDLCNTMKKYNFMREEDLFLGFSDDACSSDVKKLISKYRNLFANDIFKLMAWHKVSNNIERINIEDDIGLSFPWVVSDSLVKNYHLFKLELIKIKEPVISTKHSFFLTPRFIIVESNELAHKKWMDCYYLLIPGSVDKNDEIMKKIPENIKIPLVEIITILCIFKFLKFENLEEIYFLMNLILDKRNVVDGEDVTDELFCLSRRALHDNFMNSSLTNEEVSNILFLTAFICSLDIGYNFKISMAQGIDLKKKLPSYIPQRVEKEIMPTHSDMIIYGMFDTYDSVYFEPYIHKRIARLANKILYRPVLLNKGICSMNNYKEEFRIFLLRHMMYKETKHAHYSVKIIPGKVYLHSIPEEYQNNSMVLSKLVTLLYFRWSNKADGLISTCFINEHLLLNKNRRDMAIKVSGLMCNGGEEGYRLTFTKDNTKYSVWLIMNDGCLVVKKISKFRVIVGRYIIVGGCTKCKRYNNPIDNEEIDTLFEIEKENLIYDQKRGINILEQGEKFILSDNLFIADDTIKLGSSLEGCKEILIESISRIKFVMEGCNAELNLIYTQEYTINASNQGLKKGNKLVNVNVEHGTYLVDIPNYREFEPFFESIWKSFNLYFVC
ncbi:putative RNA-dependent RNA polymerase 1 [Astathelohania contejeani]|uniref:RNA-directed RNA polymerase n=1 Tax=Astathelohania contejeani TaxID=164912 RepID=A0ABQ7HXD6_9MICR|nr:putative RNA-dependent RNA polymerase 1 [Thelohania contejeani]